MPLSKEDRAISKALKIAEARVTEYAQTTGRINDPGALKSWAMLFYASLDQSREHFTVVCLNARHAILGADILHSGSVDGCDISIAVLARAVLARPTCTAVILVHNHPSGHLEPSAADIALTARVKQALSLFEIRVLDHLIVHGRNSIAMSEKGLI